MPRRDTIQAYNKKIYQSDQLNVVRRKPRAVTDDLWIKAMLKRGAFGTLATECRGQPFINTNLYAYDEVQNCIYIHRAKVGRTSANILYNPRVCYSVVEMGRLYGGKSIYDFGVEYRSIVVFGTARLVDEEEAQKALQMLLDKYAPHMKSGVDYQPMDDACTQRAAVYRIDITEWSGKKLQVPEDHPGTYIYGFWGISDLPEHLP